MHVCLKQFDTQCVWSVKAFEGVEKLNQLLILHVDLVEVQVYVQSQGGEETQEKSGGNVSLLEEFREWVVIWSRHP